MNEQVRFDTARSAAPVDWHTGTLLSVAEAWARDRPDAVVYSWMEDGETVSRDITFAGLCEEARIVGASVARFVKPGERVMLLYGDGPDTVIGLLGCLYAGAVPVSGVHAGALKAFDRFTGIVRDCGAKAVLGPHAVLSEMQGIDEDAVDELGLRWLASDRPMAPRSGEGGALPGLVRGNGDLALIQYTSGSTRMPRGVALTHRNVLHNLATQAESFGYRTGDVGVSWLPLSHDMGLIGAVLMALQVGGRCVMFSPARFLRRPERWLKAISGFGATISGGPNFAYDVCARRIAPSGLEGLDLSRWTHAFNGAEPVRQSVLDRFAAFVAPAGFRPQAFYPCYGLAEATLFVTGGQPGAPTTAATIDKASLEAGRPVRAAPDAAAGSTATLIGCGRVAGGQRLEIVDPAAGVALGEGRVGEIWLQGPSVASGYFAPRAEEDGIFAARLASGEGPFLRTGDLGFRLDGELFVTGRERDLIVLRGRNHYPHDIEATAEEAHASVRRGASAAFMTEDEDDPGFALACEIAPLGEADMAAVARAVAAAVSAAHGVGPRRVILLAAGGVPKTPSGKIQRSLIRARIIEGSAELLFDHGPRSARPAGKA
ncbi:fatty acyl-AMP ligase [Aureimonas pseudogalii]|uniref:fatty acyl-AMP ligase n=1 Tax=Aureimonas pseudogalii TaxID=1744844 RepID=UPI0035E611DB